MSDIKTPDQLSELTSRTNTDLLCVWDVDEVGDEKLKKMTITNFLNNIATLNTAQTFSGLKKISNASFVFTDTGSSIYNETSGASISMYAESTKKNGIIVFSDTHATKANTTEIYANNQLALNIDSSQNLFASNGSLQVGASDDYVQLNNSGNIDICDSSAAGYINFKSAATESYDCRILQNSNGLDFRTGGNGATLLALNIDSSGSLTMQNGNFTCGYSNDFIKLNGAGSIDISDSSANGSIKFKTAVAEDFDCKISQVSNGIRFDTGGHGSTVWAMEINSTGTVSIPNGDLSCGYSDDFVKLLNAGGIDISDSSAAGYINFKSAAAESYDCRILQNSNGLDFYTGGNGSTAIGLSIDSSQNVTVANGNIQCGAINNFVLLDDNGSIEICGTQRIDFKSLSGEDYDCRIIQSSNGLDFYTGGNGSAAIGLSIDSSRDVSTVGSFTAGSGNDFVKLDKAGGIEMSDLAGNAWIDFKTGSAEDYDCRIIQSSNGLDFYTGGNGSTAIGLTIDSSRVANFPVSLKAPEKIVIPLDEPTSLENGCIWIV